MQIPPDPDQFRVQPSELARQIPQIKESSSQSRAEVPYNPSMADLEKQSKPSPVNPADRLELRDPRDYRPSSIESALTGSVVKTSNELQREENRQQSESQNQERQVQSPDVPRKTEVSSERAREAQVQQQRKEELSQAQNKPQNSAEQTQQARKDQEKQEAVRRGLDLFA